MIIRKLFKFEAAHIVRDCSTERCRWNMHGHSFKVEVKFRSGFLDDGGMVLDFGVLKVWVKELFEAFDHAYLMWDYESQEYKDNVKKMSRRWVELPFSPSAENMARFFHWMIQKMIDKSHFGNNEKHVTVHSVRVHETDTGYAETEGWEPLVESMKILEMKDIVFSDEIKKDTKIEGIQKILSTDGMTFDYLTPEDKGIWHNTL